jgi:hypothetical protein
MSLQDYLEDVALVTTGTGLRERLAQRIATPGHNGVVARLRRFRKQLECEMEPEPWTNLEGLMILALCDVCGALGLSDDERATVLGQQGEQALAELLDSRLVIPPCSELNDRQRCALAYARDRGSISLGVYRELCPGWSPETLRLDLADLVQRGILAKNGRKKGTRYVFAG